MLRPELIDDQESKYPKTEASSPPENIGCAGFMGELVVAPVSTSVLVMSTLVPVLSTLIPVMSTLVPAMSMPVPVMSTPTVHRNPGLRCLALVL